MSKPVICVDHLERSYGDGSMRYQAVHDLSFEVNYGEIFGLLGTNGAGKTSTLEVLEGIAEPSGGRVRVFGFDPFRDRAQVRPRTGIMLQSGGLPLGLTVGETVSMWRGTCSNPRVADEVLEDVSLGHRKHVRVGSLSGGEQRRLDLACALLGNPDLLFLDEPTTGLDPESRRSVWALLARLKDEGVTMVLTTHYLEEAEILCDRLAIMDQGAIAVTGTLSEVVGSQLAEISFRHVGSMPDLPETMCSTEGDFVVISTANLQRDAHLLLEWAEKHNVELRDFSARAVTLESVFLNVAGGLAAAPSA